MATHSWLTPAEEPHYTAEEWVFAGMLDAEPAEIRLLFKLVDQSRQRRRTWKGYTPRPTSAERQGMALLLGRESEPEPEQLMLLPADRPSLAGILKGVEL